MGAAQNPPPAPAQGAQVATWLSAHTVAIGFGILAIVIGCVDHWFFHDSWGQLNDWTLVLGGLGVGGLSIAHSVGLASPTP